MSENYYHLLGVSMNANDAEIKAAYKKLAMQYHPDRNQGSKFHEEHFKKIAEAYQTLSNKDKRSRYDMRLFYSAVRNYSSNTGPVTPPPPVYGTSAQYAQAASKQSYRAPGSPPRYAPRPRKFVSMHTVAITLLVFACMFMLSIWVNQIMNRKSAEIFLQKGDYHSALLVDETYAPAYFARAMYKFNNNMDDADALADFSKAIRYADNKDADMYYNRGLCNWRLNYFDDAIADLKLTTQINHRHDSAYYKLGDMYSFVTKYETAIVYYDTALQISPNHYQSLQGRAYAQMRIRQFRAAVNDYDRLVKQGARSGDVFYFRAYSHLGLADTLAACRDFDQALIMGVDEALIPFNKMCKDTGY